MSGRTFFVILFCWAALTVITPILVRLSASAKLLDHNGEIKNDGMHSSKGVSLYSRRALGSIGHPEKKRYASPAPSPSPSLAPSPSLSLSSSSEPHRQTVSELEVSGDMRITSIPKRQNMIT